MKKQKNNMYWFLNVSDINENVNATVITLYNSIISSDDVEIQFQR